ncbi:hypothetical protein CSB93_0982 [Pseudomonas paraeruginosa]|uniref:Uncharacterized protein n=1 Tax=Pseudomonas paraeruginosa TaxID=2994495 RepID=A0A2R3J467_9PSED|nr:hypothetical protein CSB93_0982 [Pseudomonas paraeruginosa]AWE90047.1 hypothetical protein CSC28_6299 [Pseudomonas paraeruginosa]PTC33658.1 hypothetical protein CLJ1_5952 [Pseudomonas aeruginosa]
MDSVHRVSPVASGGASAARERRQRDLLSIVRLRAVGGNYAVVSHT